MSVETMTGPTLAPASEVELTSMITEAAARRRSLRITGGGSRVQTADIAASPLHTGGISGVVSYEPGEMTLIARTGTPLADITRMLESEGQALAFEPPDLRGVLGSNGTPTIGGVVAANASGPRRPLAGACRDHLLGVRFVDGQGRIIKNGGRVMKNVTGLDLSKLMAGAYGTLGVLTEVALKTQPLASARATLAFPDVNETQALQIFSAALATPFEVSGAAFHGGTVWLRVEGLEAQLAYRRDRLLAQFRDRQVEVLDASATTTLWQGLRDVAHFAGLAAPLWRVLVKPTDAPAITAALQGLGGETSLDWGGGLIWYAGPGEAAQIRAIAPHATLIRRAGLNGRAFPPESGPVARLSAGLRRTFDPAGIFNPGLMDA